MPTTGPSWALIGAVTLFPTVLALPATLFASGQLGADRAALLLTLEPAFVLALAAGLLHEPIGVSQGLGGGLILLGAVLVGWTASHRTPQQTPLIRHNAGKETDGGNAMDAPHHRRSDQ